MDGVASKTLTEYQNAGKRPIILILLNYSSIQNRKVDLVKLEAVSICLFIGMICYSDPACLDGLFYLCEIHLAGLIHI